MLRNYFKTAWRSIRKNKVFSGINIIGLAIGISASLVIYLIVNYDLSFDRFEKDGNRIYRVASEIRVSGNTFYNPGVPMPVANAIKNEVTGVASTIPFLQQNFDLNVKVSPSEDKLAIFKKQTDIIFADERYFDMLSYQWLSGTPRSFGENPLQVVLTETRAKLYFPSLQAADVIGKLITYNDSVHATVSGIVKDLSAHSDFAFKEFISFSTIHHNAFKDSYQPEEWYATNGTTQLFLKLNEQNAAPAVEAQLATLIRKYRKEQRQDSQSSYVLKLQSLSDLHFNSDYGVFVKWDSGEKSGTVSKDVLNGLLIVGALLLLLGCMNFINLSTAQSTQRAKEIGVRKALGSSTNQLKWQFLNETFLVTVVAAVLSVAMVPVLLKIFSGFIPEGLHFSLREYPGIIVFLLCLVAAVTFLSGFYPSLVLSKYNPVQVLKSGPVYTGGESQKLWLRKSLTVSQFVIAQAFVIGTMIVSKQVHYTLSKDLGFKKDAIIYFYTGYSEQDQKNKAVLLERLKKIPGIAMSTLSNDPPSSTNEWAGPWIYKDGNKEVETNVRMKFGDSNYVNLYGLKLRAGQNLAPSDTLRDALINETYAKALGFNDPQQAVGKYLERKGKRVSITGIIGDFHQNSLHEQIKPLAIVCNYNQEACVNVRLQANNGDASVWRSIIKNIGVQYKELYPEQDFDYQFLDQSIAKFYTAEQNISVLLNWATGLSIFISCIGLLGLVIYTTQSRTKEIGIRKILGASVSHIIAVLSTDFIKLVCIAFVFAVPAAWWLSQKWLENFAYRTSVSWWLFVTGGFCMVLIALLTLSLQTIRAAMANPVKSLRTE